MACRSAAALAALCAVSVFAVSSARADDQPAAPPGPPPPWIDGIKFSGHIEAGVTVNTDNPSSGVTFGQLFTDGGVDAKLGQYPTPIGYEVIEPTGNPFYSHSYIFNFGIPLKHTGGYLTAHINATPDLRLGGDTGGNTPLADGDDRLFGSSGPIWLSARIVRLPSANPFSPKPMIPAGESLLSPSPSDVLTPLSTPPHRSSVSLMWAVA